MSVGPLAGRPARLGLVVNPIAGLGGRVGLKGTDGDGVAARALELGAEPRAGARTVETLRHIRAAWPAGRPLPRLLCAAGSMGADAAANAGWDARTVGEVPTVTSAADTLRLAAGLAEAGLDLLLFAGGDGTARDVLAAVGAAVPVLGIPAGVKLQSAVFAISPRAAGEMAVQHCLGAGRTVEREVLDLDEAAYRQGRVRPRLHGTMRVPAGRLLQSRKAPTPASDAAAAEAIAAEVEAMLEPGHRYVLGPGSTPGAVARRLGLAKTLVGVDGMEAGTTEARLVLRDAAEADLLRFVSEGPASIVLTPIGGQGFLLGRGNQPISPAVVRAVGRERFIVLATPTKLAELAGRPLLVDTGDEALDAELCGYIRVITGRGEYSVVRIEEA